MADKNQSIILIFVSDSNTHSYLVEILNGTGFAVEFAQTPEQGLRMAVDLIPAAILIDVDGSSPSSYETCRRLRADRVLEGVPIVMLIDRDDHDTRAVGLSAGADDFLEKPLDGLEMLARLRSLTRLNSYRYLLADLTRFSWMVEHAHEGYLMLDKSGVIHFANERALHLLNMPEDFFGLPFVNVVERQYVPEPAETWESWLEDPSPCFLIQPESPTARAVWVVLEALDTPLGMEYHRVVRLRDVTERMSIYQDMRHFHTVVAHKLRTPMSMLYSSISLIKSRLDVLSPEEVKTLMGSAIKGIDRLANEVRNIVTYLDAPLALNLGKPMLLSQFPQIIKESSDRFNLREVLLSLPENLHSISIAMTPDAMEIIVDELFENSQKFHPTRTPRVEISIGQAEEGFIRLRFADNGQILSAEQLEWTWLPYFQGEKDFTGEIPGLGLGFPMVATLVWKAGGAINLRNRSDGIGIVVDLKIPYESTMRKMERSASPFGS